MYNAVDFLDVINLKIPFRDLGTHIYGKKIIGPSVAQPCKFMSKIKIVGKYRIIGNNSKIFEVVLLAEEK